MKKGATKARAYEEVGGASPWPSRNRAERWKFTLQEPPGGEGVEKRYNPKEIDEERTCPSKVLA